MDDVITEVCRNHHRQCDDIVNLIPEDNTLNEHGNITLFGETDRIHSSNERRICNIDVLSKNESEMENLISQFLSVYPLEICRDELPSIRRALRQVMTRTSFVAIMNGAMSYATQCADRVPRYIADPVNWLNGERWVEKDKVKSSALVLAADGRPISTSSRPLSVGKNPKVASMNEVTIKNHNLTSPLVCEAGHELASMFNIPWEPKYGGMSEGAKKVIPELRRAYCIVRDHLALAYSIPISSRVNPEFIQDEYNRYRERVAEVDAFMGGPFYCQLCDAMAVTDAVGDGDAKRIVGMILASLTIQSNIDPETLGEVLLEIIREIRPTKLILDFTWRTIRNNMIFVPSPKEFRDKLLHALNSMQAIESAIGEMISQRNKAVEGWNQRANEIDGPVNGQEIQED
jgi:hypothetical protein